ncbi:MAG: Zn-ribbon containing protein [Candidatus Micrarchaeia archaeon]
MPHKCVRCSKFYERGSPALLKGCECGSRVFVYLKQAPAPGTEEKKLDWLEKELAELSREKPVIIDVDAVENLRILEPGSYELNLASLMKREPLVIKSDKDVYYVKLPQAPKT